MFSIRFLYCWRKNTKFEINLWLSRIANEFYFNERVCHLSINPNDQRTINQWNQLNNLYFLIKFTSYTWWHYVYVSSVSSTTMAVTKRNIKMNTRRSRLNKRSETKNTTQINQNLQDLRRQKCVHNRKRHFAIHKYIFL